MKIHDVVIYFKFEFSGVSKLKKIIYLPLCLIMIIALVACVDTYSYREYMNYDNFDTVENDFQSIYKLLSVKGENSYYIKVINENINDKKISDNTKIELTDMGTHEKLDLNEADQKHLRNILMNSYGGFCWIDVKDEIVKFEYDATGCGVVSTSDIKKFISGLENKSIYGDSYGYKKLSDDWYTYFR